MISGRINLWLLCLRKQIRVAILIHDYWLLSKSHEWVFREKWIVKSKSPERFRIQGFWWGGRIRCICSQRSKLRCRSRPAGIEQGSTGALHFHVRIHPSVHPPQKTAILTDSGFLWWGRTDSNHRSETQQIYSLSPLATRELPHIRLSVVEPVDGLEPPTYWLQISCSTDWAIPAAQTERAYYTTGFEFVKGIPEEFFRWKWKKAGPTRSGFLQNADKQKLQISPAVLLREF